MLQNNLPGLEILFCNRKAEVIYAHRPKNKPKQHSVVCHTFTPALYTRISNLLTIYFTGSLTTVYQYHIHMYFETRDLITLTELDLLEIR